MGVVVKTDLYYAVYCINIKKYKMVASNFFFGLINCTVVHKSFRPNIT